MKGKDNWWTWLCTIWTSHQGNPWSPQHDFF